MKQYLLSDEMQCLMVGDDYDHLKWRFDLSPPALITMVIHDCMRDQNGRKFSEDNIWEWSLNRRTQALMEILSHVNASQCSINIACAADSCGELMDLEFDLSQTPLICSDPEALTVISSDGSYDQELSIRLPNGRDQLFWQSEKMLMKDNIAEVIAKRLIIAIDGTRPSDEWELPESWLGPIEAELTKCDPFTDFTLETGCPECGKEMKVAFDIEIHLLNIAQDLWRKLLDEVHLLASHYHWNEQEILAIPATRRHHYLNRIGGH